MASTAPPDSGCEWPSVAVPSADMTTRGARIKRERNLRRMSQLDLHKATDVGQRTIGRIEAGEAENSPSLDVLEAYFGIHDDSVTQVPQVAAPDADAGAPPGLAGYTLMELLAESIRRVAQLEARTGEHFTGEPVRVRWARRDAPSAQRDQGSARPDEGRGAQ